MSGTVTVYFWGQYSQPVVVPHSHPKSQICQASNSERFYTESPRNMFWQILALNR